MEHKYSAVLKNTLVLYINSLKYLLGLRNETNGLSSVLFCTQEFLSNFLIFSSWNFTRAMSKYWLRRQQLVT